MQSRKIEKQEYLREDYTPDDSRAKRPVYLSKEEAISTCEKVQTPNIGLVRRAENRPWPAGTCPSGTSLNREPLAAIYFVDQD